MGRVIDTFGTFRVSLLEFLLPRLPRLAVGIRAKLDLRSFTLRLIPHGSTGWGNEPFICIGK